MKLNKEDLAVNIDQQKAIYTKDRNILVSAPAGSGKTKILVNRMMEHLLNDHYSVDDFLVVTFTSAAALEMKQRLSKEIDKTPGLEKEKEKLPYAYITNFHGFCSTLLKKYGALIDIPSNFEILEDPTLIKDEAYHMCLDQWLENETFRKFTSLYFPGNDLSKFFSQLMNLYEAMHVIVNKDTFLEDVLRNNYDTVTSDEWPVIKMLQEYLTEMLEDTKLNYEMLCEHANRIGLSDFFERPEEQGKAAAKQYVPADSYEDWIKYLEEGICANYITYDALMARIGSKPEKAYNLGWKALDMDAKHPDRKRFEELKKSVLNPFKAAYDDFYTEHNSELLNESKEYLKIFLGKDGLVEQFTKTYNHLKSIRGYLDFNDLEDYAIELLQPALPIASLLHDSLKEVMIDEYQDTNEIQEKIITLITDCKEPHIHRFMVGDVKQSIYRFRKADPKLFMSKYYSYVPYEDNLPDQENVRIDLHYNYRSNKKVLDSINYMFDMLMDRHIGDVEYLHEENHQLNFDFFRKKEAKDRYDHETRFDTELLLYDQDGDSELQNNELEAHMVAMRILDLIHHETIDTFSKEKRTIDFKDIVVLTRTATNFIAFKKVFDLYGIPNHIVLSNGFYNSVEIKAILTLMQGLCNPYNDLYMVSILRSNFAFSHFTDQDIYDLKISGKGCCLYQLMLNNNKYAGFIEVLNDLIDHLKDQPYNFIEYLYSVTQYPLFVSQLINGEQRKANLELLSDYMAKHNTDSVYEIVDDLTNKINLGTDISPAVVASENNNVVQFMTIHKSKGLEFPVVFVCNMDKGMNKQDIRQPVIIQGSEHIALKPRSFETIDDMEVMAEYNNPYHKLLSKNVGKASMSEEMRILYVAMTRASQKLIMTGGCTKDYLEKNKGYAHYIAKYEIIPQSLRNKKSYLDWVILPYFLHPSIIKNFTYDDFKLEGKGTACLKKENLRNTALYMKMYSQDELLEMIKERNPIYSKKKVEDSILITMPEIISQDKSIAVTKLIDEVPYERVYTNQRKMLATQFGSLVHQFFEYYLLDQSSVDDVIDYYYKEGLWNELERDTLIEYKEHLQKFIDSDVFTIMKECKQLLREKEFSLSLEDGTILHGTFDVLCLNDDHITIIDYKTDRVGENESEEKLKEIHYPQMSYYKDLIHKMYGDIKVEAIVYYTEIGRYVIV